MMLDLKWLLKLIYGAAKFSGFLFISVDLNKSGKLKLYKDNWNYVFFAISFGFSLYSCSFNGVLSVIEVTHSKIMEVGLNVLIYTTVYITWFVKIMNVVQGRTFFNILSNIHWVDLKVNRSFQLLN